ncbi:hypothetical protein BDV26DRAFT_260338 [Aspergillus bertholletiae]|uniref:Uncharacterized protein n=1 Tax=Aspergillus bertholletiae TaxID=1226010 RepID=A0A5N7BB16_9EURO|nr:hypothetical protein BDV26DRAFT_260338 [Aspergillus bertholletiae]
MDYAESHAHVLTSVNDLHIVRYDQAWAKNGHVLLRYTVEGSHLGRPYQGIERSDPPRRARWSAAAIFEIEDGKVKCFTKDWDHKVIYNSTGARLVSVMIPGGIRRCIQNPSKRGAGNTDAKLGVVSLLVVCHVTIFKRY